MNHFCGKSKLYANSKENFTLHVTPDEFCPFLAIMLISGYALLPCCRMYWEQAPDVFNFAVSDLLPQNRFE